MAKKIIEVPEGAVNVIFEPAVKANYADEVSYMFKHQVGVENLPDAPDKRVIELPADSIAWLERMKSNLETIDVYDLLNNILDDDSWSYHAYQFNFNSETSALNTVAEWLLGNVEFLPKNESKFRIRFVDVFDADGDGLYLVSIGNNKFRITKHTDRAGMFTEDEADKIIADISNSNVSITARKAKVEE